MSQIGTLMQTPGKGGPVMIPVLGCSIVADSRYGRLVDVVDAARVAGIGKTAIAVTPREARR